MDPETLPDPTDPQLADIKNDGVPDVPVEDPASEVPSGLEPEEN